MALSSASTDAQIQAAMDDNAGYDETVSVTMARAYRTAVRMAIGRVSAHSEQSDQGSSLKADLATLRTMLVDVQKWLNVNDASAANTQIGADPVNVNLQTFRG